MGPSGDGMMTRNSKSYTWIGNSLDDIQGGQGFGAV